MPVDGIIVVTSPQELVSLIVEKAVRMANMMNIPILGLVENMSYIQCPDCGKEIPLFGGDTGRIAQEYGIPLLARLPIDPALSKSVDNGAVESFEGDWMDYAGNAVEQLLKK